MERPLDMLPQSPDTISSVSTVRGYRPTSSRTSRAERDLDRRYTVTVNESFACDGVLLNLDLIAGDVKPGSLMAVDVVRAEADKSSQNAQKQQHQDRTKDAYSPNLGGAKVADTERRYIFTVKDMPKELKVRYPTVEVYVPKNIADAFGMKKGSQVLLTPVSPRPLLHSPMETHRPRSMQIILPLRHPTWSSHSKSSIYPELTCGG